MPEPSTSTDGDDVMVFEDILSSNPLGSIHKDAIPSGSSTSTDGDDVMVVFEDVLPSDPLGSSDKDDTLENNAHQGTASSSCTDKVIKLSTLSTLNN